MDYNLYSPAIPAYKNGFQAGLAACSNGMDPSGEEYIEYLVFQMQEQLGLPVVVSDTLFRPQNAFAHTALRRAQSLNRMFQDPSVEYIFDVSGGDMANEVLPYLDYEVASNSQAVFFGYSDLTVLLNAIYARTGKASILYQIRNIMGRDKVQQIHRLKEALDHQSTELTTISCREIHGPIADDLEGILVGGNIRCFLKLAGTPYFPDVENCLLLLEANSGSVPQISTYFAQLAQMGVFEKVKGLVLGTFTQLEGQFSPSVLWELIKPWIPQDLPVVKTSQIGHGDDSRAVWIGKPARLHKADK